MLVTVVIWLVAFSAAWGYGRLLCSGNTGSLSIECRAIRVYSGLLVAAAVLLTLALFTNLSPWTGLLVAVIGMMLAAPDADWRSLPGSIAKACLICFPLALFVTSREVNFYDTALYHQQAVSWLSQYGLVKGLALVHFRFGWTSSWFAAAAPLNHGLLAGRITGIVGGLPFVVMLTTGSAIMFRSLILRTMTFQSAVWVIFVALIGAVSILWNVDTSLSPDPIIWLLPAIAVTMLTSRSGDDASRIGPAIVVASLACLVKLNAAPVLAYCCVLALWVFVRDASSRKRLVGYLAMSAGIVSLLIYTNVRTSGCPAFPSPLGCISTGWSVDHHVVAEIENEFQTFAQSSRHWQTIPLLVAAAVASLVAIRRRRANSFVGHSLGICWTGIIFVLTTAPVPRYGMGYFLWPTAIGAASVGRLLIGKAPLSRPRLGRLRLPSVKVAVATSAAVCIGWSVFIIHAGGVRDLLYPRRMAASSGDPIHILNRQIDTHATLSLQQRQRGGLVVWTPISSDQCWDAPLPCTPILTSDDVVLREPSRGFGAGFARSPNLLVRR